MFSLRRGIIRILITTMAVVLLLSGTLLVYSIGNSRRAADNARLDELKQIAEQIETDVGQLRDVIRAVYSSDTIFQPGQSAQTVAQRWNRVYSAMNLLNLQMLTNDRLGGLILYYSDVKPTLYNIRGDIPYSDQEMLKKLVQHTEAESFMVNTAVIQGEADSYYYISMQKPGVQLCGFIRLGRYFSPSGGFTYACAYDGGLYRLASEEAPISDMALADLPAGASRLDGRAFYRQDALATRLSLICVTDDSPWRYLNGTHAALAAAIVLAILLCFYTKRYVTDELSVPLVDMKDTLTRLQGGQWDADFRAPNRVQEIEDVRLAVNAMLKGIEQYQAQALAEQTERQRTQLQYTKLQLAPHFYTNCLKNAYYMLQLKEYDALERFLLCLTTHLRYLLQTNREYVTLREEKAFVENYIDLQRQLTQREIACEMHIDEADGDILVPILALQTFVENSIKYSKRDGRDRLSIWIKVIHLKTETGERLNISYADRGAGYPKDVLAMLNSSEPADREELGVGIVNLLKRCRFHYGEAAAWAFYNDGGAVSELFLPIERPVHGKGGEEA